MTSKRQARELYLSTLKRLGWAWDAHDVIMLGWVMDDLRLWASLPCPLPYFVVSVA